MCLISVIIPTYNYGQYIQRCIESVLNQSLFDFEIIVIDDGSTDSTEFIVKSIKDRRIKYYKNEKNLGVSQSVYLGQKHAKGEYICILASDDTFPKNSLKIRYENLLKTDADVIHAGITRVKGQNQEYIPPLDTSINKKIIDFLNGEKKKVGINSVTFLYKRSLLEKIGYRYIFKEFSPHDDYEFSLRLLSNTKCAYINQNTYFYNIHSGSYIKKYGNTKESKIKFKNLINKYLAIFKISQS